MSTERLAERLGHCVSRSRQLSPVPYGHSSSPLARRGLGLVTDKSEFRLILLSVASKTKMFATFSYFFTTTKTSSGKLNVIDKNNFC